MSTARSPRARKVWFAVTMLVHRPWCRALHLGIILSLISPVAAFASTPGSPAPASQSPGDAAPGAPPPQDLRVALRLPYYSEEELSILIDASKVSRRSTDYRASGDWKAWARDLRDFLDATGRLHGQGAVALAVAYGTQAASDLVAAVVSPPSYRAASEVLEVLGDRLGPRWFPDADFEQQLRSVLAMFETYHEQMMLDLRTASSTTGRLEVARRLVHQAAEIDVPKSVVYELLRQDLEPIIGTIDRTSDARAAQVMLEDPDLSVLLRPLQERRFRKIVSDYQTGTL